MTTPIPCNKSYITAPGLKILKEERELALLICKEFMITEDQLLCKKRNKQFVFARHLYRYMLSKMVGVKRPIMRAPRRYTICEIMTLTNSKEHGTILSSIKTAQNLLDTDKNYRMKFENILSKMDRELFDLD